MQKLIQYITIVRPYLMIIGCLLMILGLLISKATLSIGMMFLIGLLALVNTDIRADLIYFLKDRSLVILTLLFFLYFFTALYSDNSSYLLERLRIKLPFLFMPAAFVVLRILNYKTLINILYAFVFTITIAALFVLVNYLLNFEEINKAILAGQAIPTPISHIRFSLLCVIAVFTAIFLISEKQYFFGINLKWLNILIVVLLVIFIHILAVRTGLAAFYITSFLLAVRLVLVKRKYILGLVIILLAIAAPVAAYYYIESFNNKIEYMRYDLRLFLQGKAYEGLSDSRRLLSIQAGIEVGNQQPLIGVGFGDVIDKLNELYKEKYPFIPANVIAHNQFVFIYAGAGILGVILSLFILLYPLFYRKRYRSWYFLAINIILLFSLMVETTLETQVGTAVYLFFILYTIILMNKREGFFTAGSTKVKARDISDVLQ